MHPAVILKLLLGAATLLPLASFFILLSAGRRLRGGSGGYVATGAIVGAAVLSFISLIIWWSHHSPFAGGGHDQSPHGSPRAAAAAGEHGEQGAGQHDSPQAAEHERGEHAGGRHAKAPPKYYAGDYYTLGRFGRLKLTIGYHIDALTICMFCMVSLIASCIHFYSWGYMHEELEEVTDHEVTLDSGSHLRRPGRHHVFFQYMSLFSFSMLGLVLAGNVAMVFVFWELVGICSYFLIGFYIERRSACLAANKAFIVNRVGDFGMLIGLMALWSSLGTLTFGDKQDEKGNTVLTEQDEIAEPGVFSLVRKEENHYDLATPDGMVKLSAQNQIAKMVLALPAWAGRERAELREAVVDAHVAAWREGDGPPDSDAYRSGLGLILQSMPQTTSRRRIQAVVEAHRQAWREPVAPDSATPDSTASDSTEAYGRWLETHRQWLAAVAADVGKLPSEAGEEEIRAAIAAHEPPHFDAQRPTDPTRYGYWLLIVAGVGIFCGCVGKSAQFPLHVWLPDAMEGPTPVSALVHSATMVAAGVYLVGRFFPVFAPEVLLVIAVIGCITLFLAATIAITATDIKRVLAYSTVSQLGYMMLALGVAGWLAGMLHLITHAFFKSLLFLCSGSVIHAVHSNEMTDMGGLRKKMPITATTMLIGCLAIAGAGVPFVIGFSGYYSKDAILEQAYAFMTMEGQPGWAAIFFWAATCGAAITAFYMFRLWYMTFAGQPRDEHRYEHAHESPKVMWIPLAILAFFAIFAVFPTFKLSPLANLLKAGEPAGAGVETSAALVPLTWPSEHANHAPENFESIVMPVTLLAFGTALAGFILATLFYGVRYLDPDEVRKQFAAIYRLLWNKWWFDELYDLLFVRPCHVLARLAAAVDRVCIDGLIDGTARVTGWAAHWWDRVMDQWIVDGLVNLLANWTYAAGLWLRVFQTGKLRQYVMFIVVGAIAIFLLISFFMRSSVAS